MATERTGYSAGGALTGVGGTVVVIVAATSPKGYDLFNNGWFVLGLALAALGGAIVLLTAAGHALSESRKRVRYDPKSRSWFIGTMRHIDRLDTSLPSGEGKEAGSEAPSRLLTVTIQNGIGTYAVMNAMGDPPQRRVADRSIFVRCYVALTAIARFGLHLLTANATIQLDDGAPRPVVGRICHYHLGGYPFPEGYSNPARARPGVLLDAECKFLTPAEHGSPDVGGCETQPHSVTVSNLTIVDEFGREHSAQGKVTLGVSYVARPLPPGW